MKTVKRKNELDVDFIQSRSLTEEEQKALSAFIHKLKARNAKQKMKVA